MGESISKTTQKTNSSHEPKNKESKGISIMQNNWRLFCQPTTDNGKYTVIKSI
jgi:hypothetical protein